MRYGSEIVRHCMREERIGSLIDGGGLNSQKWIRKSTGPDEVI